MLNRFIYYDRFAMIVELSKRKKYFQLVKLFFSYR